MTKYFVPSGVLILLCYFFASLASLLGDIDPENPPYIFLHLALACLIGAGLNLGFWLIYDTLKGRFKDHG